MFTDVVILAGGFGERLWPASKADFPKQFMALDGGISFLQNSILRSLALNVSGKIIIATRKGLEEQITIQCNALKEKVSASEAKKISDDLIIIAEPIAKHTTAPIILASQMLRLLDCKVKHSILILTSDHIIGPTDIFVKDVEKAYISATKNHIVTFGIEPTEPSTGYGYILTGEEESGNSDVYKINEFKEKPDRETAEKYIAAGNCKWNSGMFAFDCDFFESELRKCTPEVSEAFDCVANGKCPTIGKINGINNVEDWPEMCEAYSKTPAIAIDKSVAEKTSNAYAVKASFSWDDVGSWDSFEKHCNEKDNNAILVESKNTFVYSDIPVAICGLDDICVVVKNNKVLVMKKGCSGLVREVAKADK